LICSGPGERSFEKQYREGYQGKDKHSNNTFIGMLVYTAKSLKHDSAQKARDARREIFQA